MMNQKLKASSRKNYVKYNIICKTTENKQDLSTKLKQKKEK